MFSKHLGGRANSRRSGNIRISPEIALLPCAPRSEPAGLHLTIFSGESALPNHLQITAHFLIGWRVSIIPKPNSWYFCPDPQLVAGVQARCSGDLYLSLRNPDLRWEKLLSAPIAFDEPGLSALLL